MESESLQQIIDQVSREKGIEAKVLIETMEQAILTAAKRTFGMERELEARFNGDSGNIDLHQYMTVVDEVDDDEREISLEDARRYGLEADLGEELGFQIFYLPQHEADAKKQDAKYGDLLQIQQHRRGFGRIAAQTAKQVIIQRVRDAERDLVFNAFKERQGELISGTVRRFERGQTIIVELEHGKAEGGKAEAVLPPREQTPREAYRPGDRMVALLKDIDREARGPQIVLSRADAQIVVKLFEMEVPEIFEGIVKIVAAAREAGSRSKIAVTSRDADVDPVGACVGMKGSRVQAVVQELRGEKIDIVPWDRDPARFVCNAIAPAEVSKVIIDEANRTMELVVPDAKLSLAIGRRGQNVRLASQLTGWKLDIISDSRFRQIEEDALSALSLMPSVDDNVAKNFYRAGYRSLEEVAEASEQELLAIDGISTAARAAQLHEEASQAMEGARTTRLEDALTRQTQLTDRDTLLLVPSMTERVAEQLEKAGYRSVSDVAREMDVDRLAIRAGLSTQRAQQIKEGAARFVNDDLPRLRASARQREEREEENASMEA